MNTEKKVSEEQVIVIEAGSGFGRSKSVYINKDGRLEGPLAPEDEDNLAWNGEVKNFGGLTPEEVELKLAELRAYQEEYKRTHGSRDHLTEWSIETKKVKVKEVEEKLRENIEFRLDYILNPVPSS